MTLYTLTYVEWTRAADDHDPSRQRHDQPVRQAESHRSTAAAMRRAREIIGASRISSIELISAEGQTFLDPWELAEALGCPLPTLATHVERALADQRHGSRPEARPKARAIHTR